MTTVTKPSVVLRLLQQVRANYVDPVKLQEQIDAKLEAYTKELDEKRKREMESDAEVDEDGFVIFKSRKSKRRSWTVEFDSSSKRKKKDTSDFYKTSKTNALIDS
eukprot:Blabericola_migrator_1__9047@NODE_4815_length_970_cov_107_136213_g3004_i0_p3_GENE_NODE_4815_length_970_cov_107_136213_g3004_i0NODE_4815_length_970_cov_107_136213_g3004_i0_p3_ORF_typecomplete_len105_score21_82RRP7/PF12923_7/2_1e09_NODE_4815_length_970_cov_107_136213_g3004_i0588902